MHERAPGDPPELGSFLAIHARGEAGSAFAVTRTGGRVIAWCTRTQRDRGSFESLGEALQALLAPQGAVAVAAHPARLCSVVPFATVA